VIARRAVATVLLAVTLTGACGGQADISARARRQLEARLDEVRTAVAAADPLEAQSALKALERAVSQLVSADQLSDERAREILAAAQGVAAQLSLLSSPEPAFSPTAEPSETPSEKPDESGASHGDEGHGKGKGKGHEEGNGEGHG